MVDEYRAVWAVPGGGAGYSTFYAETDQSTTQRQEFADAVGAFFQALDNLIPSTVTITFDSEVRQLNDASGVLEDVEAVTPPTAVNGIATGAYAAGAGARVDWRTSVIINGRRVIGRTFIVPIIGSSFESNGTIVAASLADLQAAADAYLASFTSIVGAVVWHRPVAQAGGQSAPIQSAVAVDKSALLRSRRD